MSKKYINILLLTGVVCIWGLIIYKLIGGFSSSKVNKIDTLDNALSSSFEIKNKKDTIQLFSFKRDPFLGKSYQTSELPNISKLKQNKNQDNININKPWPVIHYLGYIKEQNNKDPLLLIKLNNILYRKKASVFNLDEIKVANFYKDSIKLKRGKEYKVIYK